jgi:hypothetical protein
VQSVVEKKGQYFCWVSGSSGIEKREVQLGMSNNTRIEIKQGLSDGEQVLLNPRLSIAEAREDDHSQDEVNVKDRFGGDKPAQLPPVGPDRSEAGGKAKGKRGPRPGQGGPGGAASGAGGTSAPGGETPAAGSYRGSGGGGAGASS